MIEVVVVAGVTLLVHTIYCTLYTAHCTSHPSQVTLGLATRVFEGEPEGSWEREMAARNQETITQVV